jgi:hypothetical protein
MKKKLVIILAVLFSMGMVSATFAATASFSDVPANHWAYKAVMGLSKDGIIEGMGDGSFKGERSMSRYEVAVLVSKAMQNEDKANAAQKVIINSLKDEFADEIKDLNLRVTKLEKNQPAFKIGGDVRLRFYNNFDLNYNGSNKGADIYNRAQERIRLTFASDIDSKWSFNSRLAAQNTTNRSGYGATAGERGSSSGEVEFDVADVTYKINPNWTFGIGRAAINVGTTNMLSTVGFWDGMRLQYVDDKFTGRIIAADISQAFISNLAIGKTSVVDTKNLVLTDFTYKADPHLAITGAYLKSTSPSLKWKIADIGAKVQLSDNYSMQAEYLHNSSSALNSDAKAQRNAYYTSLNYKQIDLKKPHTYSIGINYKKVGKDTVNENMTSLVSMSNTYGIKGWGASFDYVLAKNVQGTLMMEKLTPYNKSVNNFDYDTVVGGVVQFKF